MNEQPIVLELLVAERNRILERAEQRERALRRNAIERVANEPGLRSLVCVPDPLSFADVRLLAQLSEAIGQARRADL